MAASPKYALSTFELLAVEGRIIHALMLRIIKSRLGGSEFGFVLMGVCWPLSHILLLLAINVGLGRTAPYGESAALWFATGVVPFIAFQYMARFIALGVVQNRPLLAFSVVKVMDIVFAGAILEVLNAGLVVLIVFAILWAMGVDFMPRDVVQASLALISMIFLGLAWGTLGAIIGSAFPVLLMAFFLLQIVFWVSSGILFVPDALPEVVRGPLSYLPYLQGVEWMRSAYYDGIGTGVLDRSYLLTFDASLLCVALCLERLLRGKILQ